MSRGLFRNVALKKLSSPEQLDVLFTVTDPKAWLTLVATFILIAGVICWGIFGSIAVKAELGGMLVRQGGVKALAARYAGQVSDVRVKPGDIVKKGDVLARLDQWELMEEITRLKAELAGGKSAAKQAELGKLMAKLENASVITAPNSGRVAEVLIKRGDILEAGQPVLSLTKASADSQNLIAVFYVPLALGKSLASGMEVHIYPTVTNKQEYGYMPGTIVSISEYPATRDSVKAMLGNSELAANFTSLFANNPVALEVVAELIPNPGTPSGYLWSGKTGPPFKLESGTMCRGVVVVEQQRPIDLVLLSAGK